jgi:AraC family transcriptional activator of pobA
MKKKAIDIHRGELKDTGLKIWKVNEPVRGRAMQAHRDDHFIFIIHLKGRFLWELDFKEVVLASPSVSYIAPGQVHRYMELRDAEAWLVFVEANLISSQGNEIFNTCLHSNQIAAISDDDPIFPLIETIEASLGLENSPLKKSVISSLALAFTTMAASKLIPSAHTDKTIGSQQLQLVTSFKELLSEKFREVKQVQAYAALLNLTPLYLTEVVKTVTGFAVSYWINQQVILEAKRLLYYTNLDVKQVAYELGYDDHTYFSRFFKKHTGLTAQGFRTSKP